MRKKHPYKNLLPIQKIHSDPFSSSFSKENIDQQIFLIVANYSLPISFM